MAFTKQELERMIQDLQDQADSLVKQGDYKLADQRLKRIKELKEQLKHMKDSMEVLKLSGFSVKDEEVSPKFKKVMEEFGKGELKSSSGEKVTDPKQAKAIAYSESKDGDIILPQHESSDGGPGSGIKGHTTPENDPDTKYANFMKGRKKPLSYSEGKKLLEEAKKAGIHPDYIKGMERGLAGLKDACGEKVYTKGTEDAERSVIWVKPSEINYKIGDIIQFKGKNVKVTKITGNVVEAQVMDACSNKDSDPKVAEAEALINLCGGVK